LAALAALAWAVAAACAAPSRQLTTRIVEDPITLPKRMASVSMRVGAVHHEPTDAQGVFVTSGFRFGITDHLEWADLGLRYAFLDDRPADGRPPTPFSLALRAGLMGIGYSSLDGMIVLPVVSLDALKHVADRWALSLGADWQAQWVEHPSAFVFASTPSYSRTLGYSARRWSTITLHAAATRQLSPRVALGVVPAVAQNTDCVEPTCDWKWRSASVAVVLGVRPLSWLTVRLAPAVGVRHRPDLPLPTTYPDGTPIMIQPLTVTWVSLSGWLDFYW
jgi:hypothetical protein